eukprot:6407703-Lingulodinium_polyedra.AAC.1
MSMPWGKVKGQAGRGFTFFLVKEVLPAAVWTPSSRGGLRDESLFLEGPRSRRAGRRCTS